MVWCGFYLQPQVILGELEIILSILILICQTIRIFFIWPEIDWEIIFHLALGLFQTLFEKWNPIPKGSIACFWFFLDPHPFSAPIEFNGYPCLDKSTFKSLASFLLFAKYLSQSLSRCFSVRVNDDFL